MNLLFFACNCDIISSDYTVYCGELSFYTTMSYIGLVYRTGKTADDRTGYKY